MCIIPFVNLFTAKVEVWDIYGTISSMLEDSASLHTGNQGKRVSNGRREEELSSREAGMDWRVGQECDLAHIQRLLHCVKSHSKSGINQIQSRPSSRKTNIWYEQFLTWLQKHLYICKSIVFKGHVATGCKLEERGPGCRWRKWICLLFNPGILVREPLHHNELLYNISM